MQTNKKGTGQTDRITDETYRLRCKSLYHSDLQEKEKGLSSKQL